MLSDLAAVTPEQLSVLGLEIPDGLTEAHIPLWRSSSKAKYHWADQRSACQHLPGNRLWQPRRDREPPSVSDRVPALGFAVPTMAMCSACAAQVAISPQADAFVLVAAELTRAQQWADTGRSGAADGGWTWLQFARWKARQPLLGSRWGDTINAVRGNSWTTTALALREAVATHREDAEAVTRLLAESISDDPGRAALLERAIRMVETDSPALEESATVLHISGCPRAPDAYAELFGARRDVYEQASPWHVVAGIWRREAKRGGSVEVDLLADYLDEQFPHVHNLHALRCCDLHDPPYLAGDCVHTWAVRVARAHRRTVIEEWVNRLEMAASGLFAVHRDASDACTHLLCVPWWPLTADGMDAIAYLSQFELVCGPYKVGGSAYEVNTVAVLRVPAWAAAHSAELRSPMRSEPIGDERRQAIELAREAGVAVVGDEFGSRRKPSPRVKEARQRLDQPPTSVAGLYRRAYRPLAPGATPPPPYDNDPWSTYSVRHVLRPGSTFVYGFDDLGLLAMAIPQVGQWRIGARAEIELQTRCRISYHEDGPHLCEIDGVVEAVRGNGALVFTPEGMCDSVTIPAAYIAGLTFT